MTENKEYNKEIPKLNEATIEANTRQEMAMNERMEKINEGLLTTILAFLIGLIGFLCVIVYSFFSFICTEAFIVERGINRDVLFGFMVNTGRVIEIALLILLLVFVFRCFFKPFYLLLSKKKEIENGRKERTGNRYRKDKRSA